MNKIRRRVLLAILVLVGLILTVADPMGGYAAPGSATPAEAVTVYLHTSVILEDPDYTLGQVATVHSSDPARSQVLRQLPLGPTPMRPTLLPGRMIQERITAFLGEVAVVGGRIALLPAGVIPEDQRWFYAALLSFLESQEPYKQGRIEVELLSAPLLLEGPAPAEAVDEGMASGWKNRILFEADRSPYSSGSRSALSFNDIPAGPMQVSYTVLASGGPAEQRTAGRHQLEGSFRIWIHHLLPVARAAVDLPANQVLTEAAVVFSEEDVSLLQSDFVLQGEEIQSYKTLFFLKRGELIDGRRLQRVLAVRAGDTVMITFTRPGLQVRLPGRAFRSGSVGDIIDVRPEATAKRLQAQITSKGEVRVESR